MSGTTSHPSGPQNVLLQTGDHDHDEESACMDLLGVDEPGDVDVLFVTFTGSPRERLDAWKRHADAPPSNVGVVSVQVGGAGGGEGRADGGPAVRRISDPSDLTGVGIAISEFLSHWDGDGNRTVVCFESVTALLQYVDASRVFQFLNEITSKFDRAGVRAHFHITPEAHEKQVLSVLSSLFDDRVSAADLRDGRADGPAVDGPASDPTAGGGGDDPTDAGTTADAPDTADAGPPGEDPFQYGAASPDADDAEEPTATEDACAPTKRGDNSGGTDSTDADDEAGDDGGGDPEADRNRNGGGPDEDAGDPADVVSSVMAGEGDAAGESAFPGDAEDDGPATGDAADDAARADPDASDGTEADRSRERPADREALRRRLEHVGPGADSPEDVQTTEEPGADDPSTGDDPCRCALYQRTTAVVVGVVTMLVLISFLAAAVPMPIGTDAPVDGGADATPTPTHGEAAAAGDDDEAPGTENASTPTATATETPTETPTLDGSDDGGSSTGGVTASTPTETPTATPTETPTATPTETPDDGSLTDAIDDDDDLL